MLNIKNMVIWICRSKSATSRVDVYLYFSSMAGYIFNKYNFWALLLNKSVCELVNIKFIFKMWTDKISFVGLNPVNLDFIPNPNASYSKTRNLNLNILEQCQVQTYHFLLLLMFMKVKTHTIYSISPKTIMRICAIHF